MQERTFLRARATRRWAAMVGFRSYFASSACLCLIAITKSAHAVQVGREMLVAVSTQGYREAGAIRTARTDALAAGRDRV
jgi:hypothetical protein